MTTPTQLTSDQLTAVTAPEERILLIASAGAGKTEVLTRRILRHLQESPGDSFRILAVTFTVRAAQELQARLSGSLAEEAWRVDADTVHGFALDWLRRFGQGVDVFPDTVVFAEDADRLRLVSDALVELGEDETRSPTVLRRIDEIRSGGELQPLGTEFVSGNGSATLSDVYEGYLARLKRANGIDFPEMLVRFKQAAELDSPFIRNFTATYRHVLVDEGQDLSGAQCAVLSQITTGGVSLFVVADSKQSINAFAGGGFENAESLVGADAHSKRIYLSDNFRCSTQVLAAAESLASHFEVRPQRSLAAEGAPPGKVWVTACRDPNAEAVTVSDWVESLLSEGLDASTISKGEDPRVTPEEIAVTARARWLLDPVVNELSNRGIKISIQTTAQSSFVTPYGRLVVEGLAVQSNPSDLPAERRASDELRALGADAPDGLSILETLSASGHDTLREIGSFVTQFDADSAERGFDGLRKTAAEAGWSDDLMTLQEYWSEYCVGTSPARRGLSDFMRFLARAQQSRPTDAGVRVLNIHKVKGLEFRAVAVIGAYQDALPDYRAKSRQAIDEERRAFYVAITRAKRELLISYPLATSDRYGRIHRQVESQFLSEAGLG